MWIGIFRLSEQKSKMFKAARTPQNCQISHRIHVLHRIKYGGEGLQSLFLREQKAVAVWLRRGTQTAAHVLQNPAQKPGVLSATRELTGTLNKEAADGVSYNGTKEEEIKTRFTRFAWRITIAEFLLRKGYSAIFFQIKFMLGFLNLCGKVYLWNYFKCKDWMGRLHFTERHKYGKWGWFLTGSIWGTTRGCEGTWVEYRGGN